MLLDQSQTPLLDCLWRCANRSNAAFYTPGHKRGQGISERHRKAFGDTVFRADLPELPELDNLFAPEGVISQAQMLAAEAFGAEQTWFLVNGSTCGIQSAILATCGPGDKLILPRNAHSSVISGLVLSGAVPVYVQPSYSAEWDMPMGVDDETVEAALRAHPEARAVLVVSPTYQGICSDVSAIAHLTHRYNIPLIVDEAHGPHFAFHPQLPVSALEAGADIAVQSAHKVLSAFTQAAMLHVQGSQINQNQLSQCLSLTQSTSPSYLLLGSLDAARHQMATEGEALLSKTLELADVVYAELCKLHDLRVLQPSGGDRTRLTVNVSGSGITGFELDEILHEQYSVTAELPTLNNLTFIISLGNTEEDIERLISAFRLRCPFQKDAKTRHQSAAQPTSGTVTSTLSPRQVFYAPTQTLSIDSAAGRICAETICPYPPGIPVLLPGEVITKGAIARLTYLHEQGAVITGCQDKTLQTIVVTA